MGSKPNYSIEFPVSFGALIIRSNYVQDHRSTIIHLWVLHISQMILTFHDPNLTVAFIHFTCYTFVSWLEGRNKDTEWTFFKKNCKASFLTLQCLTHKPFVKILERVGFLIKILWLFVFVFYASYLNIAWWNTS